MPQVLNLIPQSEKQEQNRERLVKVSSIITIVLAIFTAIVGGFLYYRVYTIKDQLKIKEQSITKLKSDIQSLSSIEISARNLGSRFNTLQTLLKNRFVFSKLLDELQNRIPSSVEMESFSLGKEDYTFNISGKGADYLAVSKFITALSNPDDKQAKEGLEKLFTDVTLNSVSLDNQTSKANYFMVITFDPSLLGN